MRKRIWLWTLVALAILIGLPSHGVAQTYGPRTPLNERYWEANNPLVAAKAAAAARAKRSNAALLIPRSKAAGVFLTFDAPGASNTSGTFPEAVNDLGAIVGIYNDANSLSHGFVRAPTGGILTIDVPGAVYGTYPYSIDDDGDITGAYGDNVGSGFHSFLRAPNGTITTFDPPPASPCGSEGNAIGPNGSVTGSYFDANCVGHGFLRTPGGKFFTFDAPGATQPQGTFPFAFTTNGSILGIYSHNVTNNSPTNNFGFLLTALGGFSQITGPGGLGGQIDPFNPGLPLSINPSFQIAGTYFAPISGNPFGGNYRVFVRSASGKYVTFDAATYAPCCIWSAPSGINYAGTVTGSFNDGFDINHGFWRTPAGKVTTFDVPAAGTGFNQGTLPIGITAAGAIAGRYRDANDVTHGFVFRPN